MARPRRSIPRVQANVSLEADAASALRNQAADAGMPLVTYLDHVVSYAHRYSGEHLHGATALPDDLHLGRLRRRTTRITPQACTRPRPHAPKLFVKVDKPLADRLKDRARGMGVHYTDYLRAVLRLAVGLSLDSAQLQWPLDEEGGDVALQVS